MTEQVSQPNELAFLRAELAEQKNQTAALGAEIARLKAEQVEGTSNNSSQPSRRRMLKRLALAAVAATAATTTALTLNSEDASANVASGGGAGQTWGLAAAPAGRVPFTPLSDGSQGFFGLIGTIDDRNLSNALVPPNQPIGVVGLSISGDGVYGKSSTANGVEGSSANGFGVFGTGSTAGVGGQGTTLGVYGVTTNGFGGSFFSTNSLGVLGGSTNDYGGSFNGGKAPIFLSPSSASFPNGPLTGSHLKGELTVDSNGILFACVVSGTPGTWRKLAGVATAGSLHLLPTAVRVATTLAGSPAPTVVNPVLVSTGANPANPPDTSAVALQVTTIGGIPDGATGVVGVLTSVGAKAGGNLRFWTGTTVPNVVNLNITGALATPPNLSVSFTIPLDSTGKTSLGFGSGTVGAQCGYAVDITGYYL